MFDDKQEDLEQQLARAEKRIQKANRDKSMSDKQRDDIAKQLEKVKDEFDIANSKHNCDREVWCKRFDVLSRQQSFIRNGTNQRHSSKETVNKGESNDYTDYPPILTSSSS